MSSLHPYLQRRGHRYFFRIAVPAALRPLVGVREFTAALKTGDRAAAVPLALQLGAVAHRLFHDLSASMSSTEMLNQLAQAQAKCRFDQRRAELEDQVDEANRARILAIQRHREQAAADVKHAVLQAENAVLRQSLDAMGHALRARDGESLVTPSDAGETAPAARKTAALSLRHLVQAFLDAYPKEKKVAMFKKSQPALQLLGDLYGKKPVTELRQMDLVAYFDLVQHLPPRWAEKCQKRGLSARELAAEDHDALLGSKTFDDNYLVPIRLFLEWACARYQDQGFPTTLTTRAIEFAGEDDGGNSKQRALRDDELQRLFQEVLTPHRGNPMTCHMWWLPMLAFYTGARVNELCQANPQCDFGVSTEGIHYLTISQQTPGDSRIRKSVKTREERLVPLHPRLVEAGFIKYVEQVKASGSLLLFPAWEPINMRASTQAERWFRDLLRDVRLRDETPRARIVGFHAFRHTLLTRAADSDPPVDAGPITGHADMSKGTAQRGYEGIRGVAKKLQLLRAIQFGFSP